MKKTVLIVIRVVCIVGFLICVGVLGWYWHSDRSLCSARRLRP